MSRVRRGTKRRQRRAKVLERAKGFRGAKSRNYRTAKEAVEKALSYSYRDRRTRKRDMRSLWIIRIKAAALANGLSYSRFMNGLKKGNILLDRKILAELAAGAPDVFSRIAQKAKDASVA
ncbi:MAG: 50S ribosomal protein L20 [Candidatus Aminicenantes bacterium]|nr:50S ribosomal protein L20 [Candidatus Aminicenantes bacterium]